MSEVTRDQVLDLRDWVLRSTPRNDRRLALKELLAAWEEKHPGPEPITGIAAFKWAHDHCGPNGELGIAGGSIAAGAFVKFEVGVGAVSWRDVTITQAEEVSHAQSQA